MHLFDFQFDDRGQRAVVDALLAGPARGGGVKLLVTVNVDILVESYHNRSYKAVLDRGWINTIDGSPIVAVARLKGLAPKRVTGADICADLMDRLTPGRQRPFFLAPNEETANRVAIFHTDKGFDSDQFAVEIPPYGFDADIGYSRALIARIREFEATHLIIATASTKAHFWVDRYRSELGDLIAMPIGAGLEFAMGVVPRAPRIMRQNGIEWLWRAVHEPKRLGRRYLKGAYYFAPMALKELVGRRKPRFGRGA